MRFNKHCKIEAATYNGDEFRPSISEPWLDTSGPNPILVATNGVILATVQVTLADDDIPGYVCQKSISDQRKKTLGRDDQLILWVGTEQIKTPSAGEFNRAGKAAVESSTSAIPAWRNVLPKEDPHEHTLSISAVQLAKLAQAMGTDVVVLKWKDALSLILALPGCPGNNVYVGKTHEPGARGWIMPCRPL
jgi:hypothetical protein